MAEDDGINAGSGSPDSYEAAVLDFLDREMAAVQPSRIETDPSDELDALVSDLLRQVITETDQPANAPTATFDEAESLLLEFPPVEEEVLCTGSKDPEAPAEIPVASIAPATLLKTSEEQDSGSPQLTESPAAAPATSIPQLTIAEEPKQEIVQSTRPTPSASLLFASTAKSKSNIPKIAIASVCLLACMGLAAYHFLGPQKGDLQVAKPAWTSRPPAAAPVAAKPSMPAIPISQITPRYPELAIRTHAAATIVIEVQIDAEGKVVKATPVSGPPLFHMEAIHAAMKWRYRPASVNGVNVSGHDRVTMTFKP
jgi:TonB family protein